jgi:hypothetical protein
MIGACSQALGSGRDSHHCDELCGLPVVSSWAVKLSTWDLDPHPATESAARGFGPRRDPRARLQRRLADAMHGAMADYLAGGEAREFACASIASVLLEGGE